MAQSPPLNASTSSSRRVLLIGGLLLIAGVLLRIYAAMGDLWLDEIWSLAMSQQAKSLYDVIHFKVDNNHALNTMLLRLIGDQPDWLLYRVPSIVAGGVAIVLAGVIARRWSPLAAVLAMLLFALAYPLVLYGSEARGYSLAVMFMLLALWLQSLLMGSATVSSSNTQRPSSSAQSVVRIIAFWLACTLGMLSHPLFLQPYVALAGWTAWEVIWRRDRPLASRIARACLWHAVPMLFAAMMYAAHWSGMQVAGGEIIQPWRVIALAAAMVVGVPREHIALAIAGAIVAFALIIASIIWLVRRRDSLAVFAALVIFILPPAMVLAAGSPVLYERYFLMPMVAAWLIIAGWLGGSQRNDDVRATDCSRRTRLAGLLLVALPVAALNLRSSMQFIAAGRGHYLEALEFIAANTSGPEIVISSDHDFRNQMTIAYYQRFLDRPVRYVVSKPPADTGNEWFIVHELNSSREPALDVTDRAGVKWKRVASYGASDDSGLHWYIYHRAGP